MKELTDIIMLNESDSGDSGSDDEVNASSPSPAALKVISTETATTEVVQGTYNKKYTDAAHFWKPRPYFVKHWGWGQLNLQVMRVLLLIPNGIAIATLFTQNHFTWILTFYTFWGYISSMLAIFASYKAVQFQEWQTPACIINQLATSLDLFITIMFWVLLAPSIYKGLDWHDWQKAVTGIRMFTLHVIPMVQLTMQVAFTDMILIKEDYWHAIVLGIVYMPFNFIGQFYCFKTPLYPQTDWVKSPIGAFFTCIALALTQSFLYYWWSVGLKHYIAWLDKKN